MAIVLAMTAKAELTATPVTEVYPRSCPSAAMEVDNDGIASFYPAVVYASGTDVEVVIFDEKFSILKKFTLKDALDATVSELTGLWIESIDMQSVVVSKNFFAKNDKWCVTVQQGSYSSAVITVIDEDGKELGTLPQSSEEPCLFLDGFSFGTPYLLISNGYGESFQLYTFTGNAGVEASKVASFPKAYPNPLPAGAAFTVDFAQAADNATFFTVLDMNGRQVYRTKVKPGETSFELSGARFGHGQYVYTVVYGNGEAVSGKLLAE